MLDTATLSLFDMPPRGRMAPAARVQDPVAAYSMRPYQAAADAAIDDQLRVHRSTLAVMATGTGKTVLFARQAQKRGGALVLAHRDSLIQQAAAKLRKQTGEGVAIEKAERTAFASPFICGSVQTLRGRRLKDFAARFPRIKFIIVDEAHRATAPSYRAILDAFPEAQVLGVTATFERADGVGMHNVFESTAFRYELGEATMDGWLTPIKSVPIVCAASLDGIKLRGRGADRDFDQQQLEDAIADLAASNVRSLLDVCGNHRLIVFTPGVKTAHATAEAFNRFRPGSAIAVDGEMDDDEKNEAVRKHQGGDCRYLVNCGVYVEGHDDPELDGIFDSAPSKSSTRARQKWGRPTRIWPHGIEHLPTAELRRAAIAASPKPWAMLYDLALNTSVHDLVSPADDVLAGRATDDEIKRVKDKLRKVGGDIEGALAEVKAEQAADRAAVAARAAAMAAKLRATAGTPKTIWELLGQRSVAAESEWVNPENLATQPQVLALVNMGATIPPRLTKTQASKMISAGRKRRDLGLATFKQLGVLTKYGINVINISAKRASAIIDAIDANGRRPLPAAQLSELMERTPGEDG